MALKFKVKTKEEIPAEFLPLYAERDGGFVLDVEGAVDKGRIDEFRNTNIGLMKQVEELKARISQHGGNGGNGDPLTPTLSPSEGARESLRALRGELEALRVERDGLSGRLMDLQVNQGIIEAANKRGLRRTAIPDITARARNVFKLVNGVPTAFEADGKSVRYGKDGMTPITLEEWTEAQVQEAPHLFESNAGGGAPGSLRTATHSENPWKRESFNLTKQGQIMKRDPGLARALQAAARGS